MKTFGVGIFQLLISVFAVAQSPGGIFYHLTTKNGLSSDRVNAVIQDKEGFYWIATQDGLNRFDGSTCKVFRNIKNDSASLSHNNCIYLLEDDNGDIWVTTPRGVNRYIKKEGKFQRYYLSHPALSFDRVNTIKGMVKDEKGNIWIASAGLWQYNIYSNKWTSYLNKPGDPSTIPAGYVYWLQYDKTSKGLWMSRDGLIFFDIATGKFHHKDYNPGKFICFDLLPADGSFVLDSTGKIWFFDPDTRLLSNYSTSSKTVQSFPFKNFSGIYSASVDAKDRIWINYWFKNTQIYDQVAKKIDTTFLTGFHPQSPLSAAATNLYIDNTGIYWIATSKGISIYNPRAQAVKYFRLNDSRKTKEGLDNAITCIAEQNENIVWVGSSTGLYRYDLYKGQFSRVKDLALSSGYIRCLYLHKDSILWVGTWNAILLYNLRSGKVQKKSWINGSPQFITADSRNYIWAGTWKNGLFKFTSSGNLKDSIVQGNDSVHSLRYNGLDCVETSFKDPAFWIGYNFEYGFGRLNYNDHAVENYKIGPGSPYNNISNSVNAIKEDRQGNLWIGTYGGGLVYFDRKKNTFRTYTRNDGLKGDYINFILQDSHSNTWVTTSNGLSVIDGHSQAIINSSIDLEFSGNDFVPNGFLRRNGKLLFFCGLKIVEIDPVAYLQSSYPSRIILSSFKIFEKETSMAENNVGRGSIHLSHNQNFFSLDYSLLKPDPDLATQYAYQLKGFDNDWNYVRERRTAYYTNVPPGSYEFIVKATNESGNWIYFSQPLVIDISPPFWKTWWFYLLTGVIVIATVIYIIRSRVNQFKKRQKEQLRLVVATQEQEKKNISAELHDDLGVRLSALKYFVTSLKDHLQPGNSLATETYNRTINVIDESVEDIRYMLVNLSPKTLNEYGYLTAVEDLVNKLGRLHIIDIDLKQKGIEQRLPADMEAGLYRITQELINNTLKHALATTIRLNIERTNGFVRLQYEDNGKGFDPSLHAQGYGLQNIHTRVALLNGKIEWQTGRGISTSVMIAIPYNHT